MRRVLITVTVMCIAFTACKRETLFKEVQSEKGLFTIQVPQYMSSTDTIFPGVAVLQYANDSVPLFALAFDTTRDGLNEKSLVAFYDSTVSQPNMDDAVIEPPKFLMIDGDSAFTTRLSGTIFGEKLVYHIMTIATPTHFYYLQVWTKAMHEKDMQADIDKMLFSFHDRRGKKV